jgi:hypothetical protein
MRYTQHIFIWPVTPPLYQLLSWHAQGQWRTEGGFNKAEPNSQFRGKYISNNLIRIRVSLISKLSGTTD